MMHLPASSMITFTEATCLLLVKCNAPQRVQVPSERSWCVVVWVRVDIHDRSDENDEMAGPQTGFRNSFRRLRDVLERLFADQMTAQHRKTSFGLLKDLFLNIPKAAR